MNLVLLFNNDFLTENRVRLTGRRYNHIREILKAQEGQSLSVGLVNDRLGRGTIVHLDDECVELEVALSDHPPSKIPVTLAVALPRPPVFKRLLFLGASLGVRQFVFFHSNRVEKSFWHSTALRGDEIQQQLVLGLEQSGDTVLPDVIFARRFKVLAEDILPDYLQDSMGILAHPQSNQACPKDVDRSVTLIVGPEGGFVPYELELLERQGCCGITLGPRILRIETAVAVLLGKLF